MQRFDYSSCLALDIFQQKIIPKEKDYYVIGLSKQLLIRLVRSELLKNFIKTLSLTIAIIKSAKCKKVVE